jgi:hypothetical protein
LQGCAWMAAGEATGRSLIVYMFKYGIYYWRGDGRCRPKWRRKAAGPKWAENGRMINHSICELFSR